MYLTFHHFCCLLEGLPALLLCNDLAVYRVCISIPFNCFDARRGTGVMVGAMHCSYDYQYAITVSEWFCI
jgi:hypothetical protein